MCPDKLIKLISLIVGYEGGEENDEYDKAMAQILSVAQDIVYIESRSKNSLRNTWDSRQRYIRRQDQKNSLPFSIGLVIQSVMNSFWQLIQV